MQPAGQARGGLLRIARWQRKHLLFIVRLLGPTVEMPAARVSLQSAIRRWRRKD